MEDQYPRIDSGFQHEGLERSSIVLGLIEQIFGFYDTDASFEENRENVHPSIWNEECGLLLSAATAALAQLYQKIEEWEDGGGCMMNSQELFEEWLVGFCGIEKEKLEKARSEDDKGNPIYEFEDDNQTVATTSLWVGWQAGRGEFEEKV